MTKNIAWLFIVIIIILNCLVGIYSYMNEQVVTCKVEEKWVKRPSSKSRELYLVNCGGEIYQVSDLLFKGKFNSADIYGNLKVGKTYEITTTGYRFGFLNMYQNINKYEEVEDEND